MDRLGLENVKEELERRLGFTLLDARDYHFDHNGDRYGWVKGINGRWHYTMFVEGGRITDYDDYPLMTGIREIAKIHTGDFRLTANQNLIIGNVTSHKKTNRAAHSGVWFVRWTAALCTAPQFNGLCCSSDMRLSNGRGRTLPPALD